MRSFVWTFFLISMCNTVTVQSDEQQAKAQETYMDSFPEAEYRYYLNLPLQSADAYESPEDLMHRAAIMMLIDKYATAEMYLEALIKINFKPAFFYLAYLYHMMNQLEKAKFFYLKAIERAKSADAYNNLGYIYALEGDFKKSHEYLQEAAKSGIQKAMHNLELLDKITKQRESDERYRILQILPVIAFAAATLGLFRFMPVPPGQVSIPPLLLLLTLATLTYALKMYANFEGFERGVF